MIVLFEDDYKLLLNKINIEDFVLLYSVINLNKHYKNNSISVIYINCIDSNTEFIIPINHSDALLKISLHQIQKDIYNSEKIKYIIDKKKLLYFFPKINNVIDIELCNYLYQLNIPIDINEIRNMPGILFPIMKYLEYFQSLNKLITSNIDIFNKISANKIYKFYANKTIPVFYLIEQNGLNIDKNIFTELYPTKLNHLNEKNSLIYSKYNLYTTTGRPSNNFSNINFAALNKSTEVRAMFNSRFENGYLIEFDYSAFHPHLILDLIKHEIEEENIYLHLAKYFYDDISVITKKEHDEIKSLTFQLLYGGITKDFEIIPFFKKTNIYINEKWNEYNSTGFIRSPYSNRIIHKNFYKNDNDFNKYKLWNYLIQLLETEHNVLVLHDILKLLNTKLYKSKLILYTYDSFLFDFNPEDDINQFMIDFNKIITQNNKFPVTIKSGVNYKQMNKLTIN